MPLAVSGRLLGDRHILVDTLGEVVETLINDLPPIESADRHTALLAWATELAEDENTATRARWTAANRQAPDCVWDADAVVIHTAKDLRGWKPEYPTRTVVADAWGEERAKILWSRSQFNLRILDASGAQPLAESLVRAGLLRAERLEGREDPRANRILADGPLLPGLTVCDSPAYLLDVIADFLAVEPAPRGFDRLEGLPAFYRRLSAAAAEMLTVRFLDRAPALGITMLTDEEVAWARHHRLGPPPSDVYAGRVPVVVLAGHYEMPMGVGDGELLTIDPQSPSTLIASLWRAGGFTSLAGDRIEHGTR
ncbi:hypothetical protein [Leifsonia sp. Leaf264]|uniref:hypothetical protein n=1 Tax=Leifsonia sp. Leaf264 TaxID=1736314 RepID=UPI0006FCCC55|nr:hypothetical protein [Leifsonia sp. Leaf264]KQP01450.1 hypothetical protein ASF30_02195 [Leifsonia sp. Leaf264]